MSASAHIEKPASAKSLIEAFKKLQAFVDRPTQQLLLIDDNAAVHKSLVDRIGSGDVNTTAVATAAEGMEMLAEAEFDCVVLDLMLPAAAVITKGPQSLDRLFDETALFLHRALQNLTPQQRRIVEELYARSILAKGPGALVRCGSSQGNGNGDRRHGAEREPRGPEDPRGRRRR